MKKTVILAGAVLACTLFLHAEDVNPYPYPWPPVDSSSSSSSSSVDPFIGDFTVIGMGKDGSIALSNNVFYRPVKHHYRKAAQYWKLNDTVRLLHSEKRSEYVLINLRNGKTIKADILEYD